MKRLRPFSYGSFILCVICATVALLTVVFGGFQAIPMGTLIMAGAAEFSGLGMLLLILSYIPEWMEWFNGQ